MFYYSENWIQWKPTHSINILHWRTWNLENISGVLQLSTTKGMPIPTAGGSTCNTQASTHLVLTKAKTEDDLKKQSGPEVKDPLQL